MKILITGAAGIAGRAVVKLLRETTSHQLRLADVTAVNQPGEFVRCDTRTASDVDAAMAASLEAGLAGKVSWLISVVHDQLGCPAEAISNFAELGPDWLEQQVPGAEKLIEKYGIEIPAELEQHDLSEANRLLGWKPAINFTHFLRDLHGRDLRGGMSGRSG